VKKPVAAVLSKKSSSKKITLSTTSATGRLPLSSGKRLWEASLVSAGYSGATGHTLETMKSSVTLSSAVSGLPSSAGVARSKRFTKRRTFSMSHVSLNLSLMRERLTHDGGMQFSSEVSKSPLIAGVVWFQL
jgi:hypothetical protein